MLGGKVSCEFTTYAVEVLLISYEENREQRVGSWRNFTSTNKKKKKSKGAVLG